MRVSRPACAWREWLTADVVLQRVGGVDQRLPLRGTEASVIDCLGAYLTAIVTGLLGIPFREITSVCVPAVIEAGNITLI